MPLLQPCFMLLYCGLQSGWPYLATFFSALDLAPSPHHKPRATPPNLEPGFA